MLFVVALVIHVLVAVLAIGLTGAIPLTARLARQSPGRIAGAEMLLGPLLRTTQFGILAMALTGLLLDFAAGGAFHRAGWFQVAIGVLVVTALAHARARAALRRRNDLALVERWGWVLCGFVGLLTILMVMKPLS